MMIEDLFESLLGFETLQERLDYIKVPFRNCGFYYFRIEGVIRDTIAM